MNWRTDKPTAKLIVADIVGSRYPEVLKLGSNCYYGTVNHLPIDYDSIERWADLEEENYKTTYPNTDFDKKVAEFKQRLINKKAITNYEDADPFVGIYWTQLLEIMHSFGQWGLDQFNYSKDETVTDCHQLEEEIDLDEEITKYWKDISSIYGAVGKEITRFDFDDACKYFYELGLKARKEE